MQKRFHNTFVRLRYLPITSSAICRIVAAPFLTLSPPPRVYAFTLSSLLMRPTYTRSVSATVASGYRLLHGRPSLYRGFSRSSLRSSKSKSFQLHVDRFVALSTGTLTVVAVILIVSSQSSCLVNHLHFFLGISVIENTSIRAVIDYRMRIQGRSYRQPVGQVLDLVT